MEHHFEVYPITLWSITKQRKIVWDDAKQLWVMYTLSRRTDAARDIWVLCRTLYAHRDYMIIPPGTPHVTFPKETNISDVFEHMFLRKTGALIGNAKLPYSREIEIKLQNTVVKEHALETLVRLGIATKNAHQGELAIYHHNNVYRYPLFSYGTSEYSDKY